MTNIFQTLNKTSQYPDSLLSAEEISFILNAGKDNFESKIQEKQHVDFDKKALEQHLLLQFQPLFSQNITLTVSLGNTLSQTRIIPLYIHEQTLFFGTDESNFQKLINLCLGDYNPNKTQKNSVNTETEITKLLENKISRGLKNFFRQCKGLAHFQDMEIELSTRKTSLKFSLSNTLLSDEREFSQHCTPSKSTLEISYPPIFVPLKEILQWKKGETVFLPFFQDQSVEITDEKHLVATATIGQKNNKIAVKIIDKVASK